MIKNKTNNDHTLALGIARLLLSVLVLTGLVLQTFALDADSLGGNPWTSYLRSNVADTVNGPLWINLCEYAQFTAEPNKYGMYWDNYGMASVRSVNYARGGWGILANHHGIDNGVDTARYWLEVRCDSTGGGIKIEGQQKAIFPIKVNNPSRYGAGLGVFTDEGSGIYIDHGGSTGDTNSKAVFIENNWSSVGYGLYMLAAQGSKGRMLWYEDRGTGQMMRTQQYDPLKPSLTIVYKDTNNSIKNDSSMYYWWGVKAKKIVADTFYGAFVGNIQNVVTLAKNSDSLGGVAARGYLRSNVQDTATGNLYLNNVKWLFQSNDSLSGYGQQWQNYGLASIYSVNYNPTGTSILGVNKGIDNNVDKRSFWMTIRSDSSGGAIRMFGNSKANQIMVVEGVSPTGSGIGIYNQQGTGLYVSHSGEGRGISIMNGLQSTGTGLQIENQNTGTALYVSDTKNGRMIVTSQDLADKPAITVGYKFGQTFHDSAMLYHWGLKSHKVVADTLWGRILGTSDSAVISGRTNLLKTGMEYQSGDKFLRTDKTDTARFVVFDSIKVGKIVDLNVANSTNANYLLYGSSFYSGTSYLRSDAADTVNGPLWINLCKYAQFTAELNKYGMYWDNYGMASVRSVNYARGGWGILANHHGIDDGEDTASFWLEVRCDSTGGGIKIEGQQKAIFPIKVNNPSRYGAGLGVFTDEGSGIYIDHGGSTGDTNSKAMFIENNWSSVGYGLYMIAAQGSKGRMLWYEDRGTGQMMRTQQYDQSKPSLTVIYMDTTGKSETDSSMYYWWGVKAKKIVADTFYGYLANSSQPGTVYSETLATKLCGRRYFGNSALNTIDTIKISGVSDSTTTVTVSYGRDTKAATWNSPMVWVAVDTIFVQRQQKTDPNNYYWQAVKTMGPGQIFSGIAGDLPVPQNIATHLRAIYPNPASSRVTIDYQVAPGGGLISIEIYNLLGQNVKTLVSQWQQTGSYSLHWEGKNNQGQRVASGIYLCRFKAEGCQDIKKLTFIH